jgi:hypothetical protein
MMVNADTIFKTLKVVETYEALNLCSLLITSINLSRVIVGRSSHNSVLCFSHSE